MTTRVGGKHSPASRQSKTYVQASAGQGGVESSLGHGGMRGQPRASVPRPTTLTRLPAALVCIALLARSVMAARAPGQRQLRRALLQGSTLDGATAPSAGGDAAAAMAAGSGTAASTGGGQSLAPAVESDLWCQGLAANLLSNCPLGLDRISLRYSRGSDAPPTPTQRAAALAGLKAAGLPLPP